MAVKEWEEDMSGVIGKLEELLFDPQVSEVVITGDGPLTYRTDGQEREVEGAVFPEHLMRDFANEILLPNIDFKGNRTLIAARLAGGDSAVYGDRILEDTAVHEAALKLRSPYQTGRSIYVREHSVWQPAVDQSRIAIFKAA